MIAHDKAGVQFLDRPGRREATRRVGHGDAEGPQGDMNGGGRIANLTATEANSVRQAERQCVLTSACLPGLRGFLPCDTKPVLDFPQAADVVRTSTQRRDGALV
jgi:hypothetical protein